MNNFLNNLAIDRWFKILVWLGALLLAIALLSPVKWLTNADVGLLGLSLLLIGLGEWKTNKIIAQEYRGGILQIPIRHLDLISIILWGAGLFLLAKFILKVL